MFAEIEPIRSNKCDTSSHNSQDRRNKTEEKAKEAEKSTKDNKARSNVVTKSPLKRKFDEEEDSSSFNKDLQRNKYTSKKSRHKNLEVTSVSVSTSKKAKDTEEQSPDRKNAKTVDLFEERIEKKKQRALMYEKYLQRGGARNAGSKEIPVVKKLVYYSTSSCYVDKNDSYVEKNGNTLIFKNK